MTSFSQSRPARHPATGTVTVTATTRNGHVTITTTDPVSAVTLTGPEFDGIARALGYARTHA